MQISQIMGPIPLASPLGEPPVTGEEATGEEATGEEAAGEEATGEEAEDGDGGSLEGEDDGLFDLQGEDFDQELAARIMMQDELSGGEGHVDWVQDISNLNE